MKCGSCGAWTEVLSTRKVDDGLTLRRVRLCGNNHRTTTYEVLGPIYRRDPPTVRQTVGAAQARALLYKRDTEIARLARETSRAHAASSYGMTEAAVKALLRRVKRRDESPSKS